MPKDFSKVPLFLLTLAAAFALSVTSASAGTIEVPSERNTIQKAVDVADPGDTIVVAAKVNSYRENVDVATNNLTIKGENEPILDGTSRNGNNDGPHFDIDADQVTVTGFTLNHGTGIDCTGDRCSFKGLNMHMSDNGGDCVEIIGPKGSVERSRFIGCDNEAIDIDGARARIVGNYMRQVDSACVVVDGNSALIERNAAQNCEDSDGYRATGDFNTLRNNSAKTTDGNGFETTGKRNTMVGNSALNIEDDCFNAEGIGAEVRNNDAKACDGGFEVTGENMKVVGNRGSLLGDDDGFDIDCNNRPGGAVGDELCRNALIKGNFASDNNNDDEGFDIFGDSGSPGMVIRNNVSEDNNDGGFNLKVTNARIVGNVSRRDGAEGNESGFEVFGDGHNLIEDNRALTSGEHGFEISSRRNKLRGNVSKLANVDGFHANGNRTKLIKNRAVNNRGDGFENDGDNAQVVKNVAKGNRRDCANDGTLAEKRDNKCDDGSNFEKRGTVDRRKR